MKRVLIFGAGVTGLSIAKLLHPHAQVTILEQENQIGGLARTKIIDGDVAYHLVGGHCFNSKYPEVMDFVFQQLPQDNWHKIQRISRINFGDYEVNYPIEFAMKEIFAHNPQLAMDMTRDFLSANDDGEYRNLEEWFRKKFGDTLCNHYFLPYNTKIWGKAPHEMSPTWVEDKLPIPDKTSFFASLLSTQKDTMAHSSFYYPNSNNQQTLFEALAKGLDIRLNTKVDKVERKGEVWRVNDIYEADILISTIPIKTLPSLIAGTPVEVLEHARQLKYNKISNVIWRSRATEKTWTYQPLASCKFHRYIHIGSFHSPARGYTITEMMGEHSFDEMVSYGQQDPFLIEPLAHNTSEHAYVVYDDQRSAALSALQSYLKSLGVHSIGRFGQWDYFNMDVCIKQSLNLFTHLRPTL